MLCIQVNCLMKGKRSKQQVQEAAVLIGDFSDESQQKRVNAAKGLRFIAEVLGNDRIKNQLIPFLRKEVILDDAPVVAELVSQLHTLAEVMGGGVTYSFLFPLLEDILEFEDDKVKRKAIEKYYECIHLSDFQKCEGQIAQSLRKLFTHDYDEVKQAFCCVVSRKLGLFSQPVQQQFIQNYLTLAQSPSLIKRRAAAKYTKDLIAWLGVAETSVLRIVQLLTKDKEESNKIYLVDALIELAKAKPPSALQSYFNIISYQFTWRIRYELISKIEHLAKAMGKQNFKSFLGYYIKYINDIQPQIRSIANSKLQELLPFLDVQDIMSRVVPAIKNIPQDPQTYVRNALASSLLHLCPYIGKKNTIEAVLPKFLSILKDEQQQQVKNTIFKKVHIICQTLGIETLSQSVMPILQEMLVSNNWRQRAQSIQILGYLIKNSPINFLTQKIIKYIIDYLKDRANSVRKQGVKLIARIIQQHGQPWGEKNILPKIIPMFKSTTFLHRQTIVLALEFLIPKLSQDTLIKQIYPNVVQLVQDPVQNVKLSVCIALGILYPVLPKEKDAIKKWLRNLKEDKDNDVKQQAAKTLSKLQ